MKNYLTILSGKLFGRNAHSRDNWNNWIAKNKANKWHKVDKDNFVPPKHSTNIVFFTKSGSVFTGYYKGSIGFICYGISKKELTDVEVTHWRNLDFPEEYQQMLDEMDNVAINNPKR